MSTTNSDQRKPLLGTCSFCKAEFAKGDMTRHIKTCKKRGDLIAPETLFPKEEHERLLQLQIEGKYNPQYWMQIELPETATLDTLDQFLRNIWLECCGHLSSFTIGETTYGIDESPFGGFFEEVPDEKVEEEEEEEEDTSRDNLDMEATIAQWAVDIREALQENILEELKAFSSMDDVVSFARTRVKTLDKERMQALKKMDRDEITRFTRQIRALQDLIEEWEETSLDVPLFRALKARKKFSYEYDFGSTTYLELKIVSSRKGIWRAHPEGVEVLARNVAPIIVCKVCGKPAKLVAPGGFYDVEEHAYCKKCARIDEDFEPEEMLPVVNSPRVGICAYGT